MNVYSDFIFHFKGRNNDGFGNLLSILEKGFRFSNKNPVMPIDSLNRDTVYEYRPGMICFTDIPFKLIPKHAVKYGKFGIGMKKTWDIEAEAQTVLYTMKESLYYKSLQTFNNGVDRLVEKNIFRLRQWI
jgi:hypothetical protein